jgi:transcriptional regulator with XRE-family HTH domain
MPGQRKMEDEDVRRLRWLAENENWSADDLAVEFGISRQHVGRLVRGDQRPEIGADAEASGGVRAAVDEFLDGIEFAYGDEVLAETARAVASKLDACGLSDSASAAQAVPRLAAQLVHVLEAMRDSVARPPDRLDELRAERTARLAAVRDGAFEPRPAMSWGTNGNGNGKAS